MKSRNIIITAIIVIVVTATAFFGYKVYHRIQLQESFRRDAGDHSSRIGNGEGEIPQSGDLCSGTGGIGQIISIGNSTITIKRRDDISQILNLTDQTTIKISTGSATKSDLKTGDRVAIVTYDSKTATAVLVCN